MTTTTFVIGAIFVLASNPVAVAFAESLGGRDAEKNDALTPFFLQDPNDSMCLGQQGFGACDMSALWVYTSRGDGEGNSLVSLLEPDPAFGCLSRLRPNPHSIIPVGVQGCGKKESKHWFLEGPNENGYFRLTDDANGGKCVTRYKGGGKKEVLGPKGRVRNSASLQPCERSTEDPVEHESGYVQLDVVETAVHDAGFYVQTVDGKCFDGEKFRKCEPVSDLLWGFGLQFHGKGEVERTLFKFHRPSLCLVEDAPNSAVELGECSSERRALKWGLKNGRLSRDNDRSCVVRTLDNGAAIRPCSEAHEHLTLSVPREAEMAREQSAEYQQKNKVDRQNGAQERPEFRLGRQF